MPVSSDRRNKQKRRSIMIEGHEFRCGVCGQPSTVFVDPSAGASQSYVEDCQVCCRPHRVEIAIDPESGEISVHASFEG